MLRGLLLGVFLLATAGQSAVAKDLSAETLAIVHDLMTPYQGATPASADADPIAVKQALEILQKEKLLDTPRPTTLALGIADKLGRALAVGNRTSKFLPEIAAIRDAIVHQDDKAAGLAIQDLYSKLGRKPPEEPALGGLLIAAKNVVGTEPQETERVEITRPDYSVVIENARAAGKAKISVLNKNGPDGKPARVDFKGDVGSRPDPAGKDLQTVVSPKPAPETMTAAQADALRAKLNGRWSDQSGLEYEVTGAGDAIVVTDLRPGKSPRAYAGYFNLGFISVTFPVTKADDIGADLPLKVRAQLATMRISFRMSLSASARGDKLDGTWSSQNVTYSTDEVVESLHDPYDVGVTLSRKSTDYHVAGLSITYQGWEQRKLELQSNVNLAQHDLERAQDDARFINEAYEKNRSSVAAAEAALVDAQARYAAASERATNYVPADTEKSAAYQRLEKRRDALTKRVDGLYEAIMLNKDHYIADSAFETYQQKQAELDDVTAQLEKLDQELGFKAEHNRLNAAAGDAFVAMARAELDQHGAVAVLDGAHSRSDEATLRVAQMQAKLSQAELELAQFQAGAFRISGIEVMDGSNPRYKAEAWDPSEVLAFLDREIAQFASVLAQSSAIRDSTRAEFLATQSTASEAQLKLADGIMKSAIAQGLTETAFNTVDVIEKTVEAGPVGALGESAKKVVEAVIIGPPSFYEPSLAPEIMTGDGGPFSDIRANIKDALKYSAKRVAKSGVSSPAASIIINQYLAARDTRVYMELIDQAVTGSMQTGYRIVGQTQGEAASQAFEAMQKARAGLKKALDQGLVRNLAGLTRGSFKEALKKVASSPQAGKLAHSVARDLAKMATKKAMAEWLEGVPLANYLAAEAEARLSSQIFLAASSVYWDSYDDHRARVEERREILRQYDAKNQMRILTDEKFSEAAELTIVLRDPAGKPISASGNSVTLLLGGKPAERLPGDELAFRITASNLAHDETGGVQIAISVDN